MIREWKLRWIRLFDIVYDVWKGHFLQGRVFRDMGWDGIYGLSRFFGWWWLRLGWWVGFFWAVEYCFLSLPDLIVEHHRWRSTPTNLNEIPLQLTYHGC